MSATFWATTLTAGLAVGFVFGILAAAYVSNKANEKDIERGFITMNGKIFRIQQLENAS